jgi:hypothetical protein
MSTLYFQGDRCYVIYDDQIWPRALVMVLACLCIVATVLTIGVVYKNKDNRVIKASSYYFCQVILVGFIVAYVGIIIISQKKSDVTCAMGQWFMHTAFVLVFPPLFLRTWRIVKIFQQVNKQRVRFKKVTIPDSQLKLMTAVCVALFWVLLSAWQASDGIEAGKDVFQEKVADVCVSSSGGSEWSLAFLTVEGIALLVGVVLCIKVRNAPMLLNESKLIGFSLYNAALVGLVLVPLIFGMDVSPDVRFLFISFGLLIVTTATGVIIFLPKVANLDNSALVFETQYGSKKVALGGASRTGGTSMRSRSEFRGKITSGLSTGLRNNANSVNSIGMSSPDNGSRDTGSAGNGSTGNRVTSTNGNMSEDIQDIKNNNDINSNNNDVQLVELAPSAVQGAGVFFAAVQAPGMIMVDAEEDEAPVQGLEELAPALQEGEELHPPLGPTSLHNTSSVR